MINPKKHAVTVIVTDEHFRKMVDGHLLKEDEIGDDSKVARAVQMLPNSTLELPEEPQQDWDDWVKGLQ